MNGIYMKNNKICVVGLGYVGLPLAVAFAEKFNVIGFDINSSRLKELEGGYDRTFEVEDDLLTSVKNNITYTSNIQDTKDCNIYIVTVPTPIDTFLLTSETNPDEIIKHQQRVKTNTIQIVDKLASGTYVDIRTALPNIKLVQVVHVIDGQSP